MDMITVTFKDDNGVWAEQMTMKEIAALSTATGVKIVRFESHRERELECCLEDITRTPATMTRTLDAIEGQFYELQKFAQKGLDRDPCFTKVIDDVFIKNTLNHQLQAEVDLLNQLVKDLTNANNPAVAAIDYVLNSIEDDSDSTLFLRMWNEGDFDGLRESFEDIPDEVFEGAEVV